MFHLWLSIPQICVLCTLIHCLYVNHHTLCKTASLVRTGCWNNLCVQRNIVRRQFDRMPIFQNCGSRFIPSTYYFPSHTFLTDLWYWAQVEQASKPTTKQQVIPQTSMPLLICLVMQVIATAQGGHGWMKLLLTFLLQHPAQHLTLQWKQAGREDALKAALASFLQVL